jgi:hypothetical protein
MDVCAKGRVTVCIDPKDGRDAAVMVVDPLEERQAVYDKIVSDLGRES